MKWLFQDYMATDRKPSESLFKPQYTAICTIQYGVDPPYTHAVRNAEDSF